jgi:hypothetical protein
LQNIFPGLGLTLSVEGTYTDARRFIHDLEASRQFLVINSIELEGMKDAGRGANTLVNLNLNMTAFFRSNAAATGDASDSTAARSSIR